MMISEKFPAILLVAEDNPDDRLLLEYAWQSFKDVKLHVVSDGEELTSYLQQVENGASAFMPNLILLDLNMPKKDGFEVLQEIKANPKFRKVPVIVLSTSMADPDVERSYQLGANGFIAKPERFDQFASLTRTLYDYWLKVVELP